jgi:hypothetical protein
LLARKLFTVRVVEEELTYQVVPVVRPPVQVQAEVPVKLLAPQVHPELVPEVVEVQVREARIGELEVLVDLAL